jgi:hypothetical protein
MELNACVWDTEQKSVSFTIQAVFPTTPRWQNFKVPRRGALVNIMGDIVGWRVDGNSIVVGAQSSQQVSPSASPSLLERHSALGGVIGGVSRRT